MFGFVNVTTNINGVPYLKTTGVTVGTETVDFALGFRKIAPLGFFAVHIANAIPEGTTGTLPIRLTLNGNSRNLTYFGGDSVTAADLASTGVILVFYNWYDGSLQLISPTA